MRRVLVPLLVVAAALALAALAWRTGTSGDAGVPHGDLPAAVGTAPDEPSRRGDPPAARAAAGPAADLDPATTIRGRVTDSGDAAVVGARITLHAPHPKDHVEGSVHLADFDRALAETTTAWDGTFALPAGSAEERIVVAAKEGFVPAARRARPGEECALRLAAGEVVRLRIVDLTGAPIAGATVYARAESGSGTAVPAPAATSDAEGRAAARISPSSLLDGRLGLVVRAAGYAATYVGESPYVLDEEERTVVLEDASVLAGHVVDGAGTPLSGVVVRLGSRWEEEVDGVPSDRVVTAEDGGFRFEGVSPSHAREISARVGDREARIRRVFPGRTDVRLVLRGPGRVRGVVVREDGSPAPGAELDRGSTGDDGSFELDSVPGGPQRIGAEWRHGDSVLRGSSSADVPEGGTLEGIRIVVREQRRGSRLRVSVVDADGRPVEECRFSVFQGTELVELSNAPGTAATLSLPVPAGTPVRVVASPTSWDGDEQPAASGDAVSVADVDGVAEPVLLRLGPPGKLKIRLEDPHGAEVPLSSARISFGNDEAPAPRDGTWPLHPARGFDVRVDVSGFARQRVSVEPPHPPRVDLRIRLSRAARIVGRLLESDGRPADWGTPLSLQIPFDGGRGLDVAIVGQDGRFEKDGLPPGDVTLSVGMPGDMHADSTCRLRRALRLEAGATSDLGTIVLPRMDLVEGVVTDESGVGLGGASVRFVDASSRDVVAGIASGPDGRFRARLPLREGVFLSVLRAGHGPALVPFEPAGPRPVRIVLRPGGRVRVRFDGDFSFVRFRTSPGEDWRNPLVVEAPTAYDDEFTIDGLPAGEVELVSHVLGVERTIRVTVVAGETVEARF